MRPCRLATSTVCLASMLALSFVQGCALFLSLDEFDESSDAGTPTDAQTDAGKDAANVPDAGSCSLKVYPASHDFGPIVVGDASPPVEFFVVSDHEGPIGPLTLFGGKPPNPNFNIIAQSCSGKTLELGESCTIDFVFVPKELGPQTAPLFIRDGTADCATAFMRGEGRTSDPPDPPDASPPDTPPTSAVVVNPPVVSDTEIGLSWSPVADATEYGVLWSNVNEGAGMTVGTTWAILETDTSIDHWFTIFACNGAGCGPPTYVGPIKK
jgi:hypothetical protein